MLKGTLTNDFFHIISREDLHFVVQLNARHPIYKGHFPSQPVTPGACLMQMTEELLSLAKGQRMQIREVTNLKFVALHTPDKPIEVDFKDLGNDKYQITIYDSQTVYAKMSQQYMCADSDL